MAGHDPFSRTLPSIVASPGRALSGTASPSAQPLLATDVARAWAQFIETIDQPEIDRLPVGRG